MNVRIRLFARARDLAGTDAIELEMPGPATVGDLRKLLAARYPAIGPLMARSAFAVNNEFADDDAALDAAAEIALLPPVSGG